MAKKEGSHENPFFRGKESEFRGGDLTIDSPVGSIFGDYVAKGNNAIESAIAEQAPHGSKKGAKS
jgi:hypothetical protein